MNINVGSENEFRYSFESFDTEINGSIRFPDISNVLMIDQLAFRFLVYKIRSIMETRKKEDLVLIQKDNCKVSTIMGHVHETNE